jgi:hypothetical protein
MTATLVENSTNYTQDFTGQVREQPATPRTIPAPVLAQLMFQIIPNDQAVALYTSNFSIPPYKPFLQNELLRSEMVKYVQHNKNQKLPTLNALQNLQKLYNGSINSTLVTQALYGIEGALINPTTQNQSEIEPVSHHDKQQLEAILGYNPGDRRKSQISDRQVPMESQAVFLSSLLEQYPYLIEYVYPVFSQSISIKSLDEEGDY